LLLGLSLVPRTWAAEAPLNDLDDTINGALKDWEVPGLAIAVVKDDAVVLARGYGVRKLGDTAPVDEHTLFAIGSASKAFTAAALAILVDDGKVKWDDPVSKYLPDFQLSDPYVTRELTVRDLLCHRSGLARHDLLWLATGLGRDEILSRLREVKSETSFRSKFGYHNTMFLAAGQIVPVVTGKSWDDFVKERIFKPLAMTASTTSVAALAADGNVATPYEEIDGKVRPIPYRNVDNIGPAAAINSNVAEMGQWVRLHLNDGVRNKERLLSCGTVREMQTPQTVIRLEGAQARLSPESHFAAYGLGWFLQDYRDRKLVQHGGSIDGMVALVALMPEEKLGLVILANRGGTLLPTALMYQVLDAYLKAPPRDWIAEFLKQVKTDEATAKAEDKKTEERRVKGTAPSLPLCEYVGTYNDALYGTFKVTWEKEKLVATLGPPLVADLEHWNYDTFRGTLRDRTLGKLFVTFGLNPHGEPQELKLDILADVIFKRTVEGGAGAAFRLSEEELKKFVGKYALDVPPMEVSIELVGGKLKEVISGQTAYTLVPVGPERFRIDGVPAEYLADFEVVDGKVKSLKLAQGRRLSVTLHRKP
jgi:CubicO group peptidase (beta-lactamase class C family)